MEELIGQSFIKENICLEIALSDRINIIMTNNLCRLYILEIKGDDQNKAGQSLHGYVIFCIKMYQ